MVCRIAKQKKQWVKAAILQVNTGDLGGSDPPSSGFFKEELVTLHRQILSLLEATGSRFMVNVYPFLVAEQNVSPLPQELLAINHGRLRVVQKLVKCPVTRPEQ